MTERSGKCALDLEYELGHIDKEKLKPDEALKKLKQKHLHGNNVIKEHAESIVYVDEVTGEAQVAYKLSFLAEGLDRPTFPVVIQSTDGKVLVEYDRIQQHSLVRKGTGPGGNGKIGCYDYGQTQPLLKVKNLGDGLKCRYETKGVKVVHLNGSRFNFDNTPFEYDCFHQESDEINGGCSPLNDALYFGNRIDEMYRTWYDTPPLNGPIVLKVHFRTGYENAFWDGEAATFGDGASAYYPQPTLDIISHEVAHGITDQSSNLIYRGESGGMNEAFSDMAGKTAERYVRGYKNNTFNWGFDYDSTKGPGALRCMNDPPCDGWSIDHVSKYHEGMDVHLSSGIYNKVFYRLATKFKYDLWDAFDLFYIANTKFWGPNTNFFDGAEMTLKAMEELKQGKHLPYGYSWINIKDIVAAFAEVGINCSTDGKAWNCVP